MSAAGLFCLDLFINDQLLRYSKFPTGNSHSPLDSFNTCARARGLKLAESANGSANINCN